MRKKIVQAIFFASAFSFWCDNIIGGRILVTDDKPYKNKSPRNQRRTEADMDFYADMDTELKSSFTTQEHFFSNVQDETLFPQLGLKARNLLNSDQMVKLTEIRKRHLKKGHQQSNFNWD